MKPDVALATAPLIGRLPQERVPRLLVRQLLLLVSTLLDKLGHRQVLVRLGYLVHFRLVASLQVFYTVERFLAPMGAMGSPGSVKSRLSKHIAHVTVADSLLHLLNGCAPLDKVAFKCAQIFLAHLNS